MDGHTHGRNWRPALLVRLCRRVDLKKTKNGRLASLAPNPLVTVPILELLAKWVNDGFTTTLPPSITVKELMKIGQHLAKLRSRLVTPF